MIVILFIVSIRREVVATRRRIISFREVTSLLIPLKIRTKPHNGHCFRN
jgi:hypothetical protein